MHESLLKQSFWVCHNNSSILRHAKPHRYVESLRVADLLLVSMISSQSLMANNCFAIPLPLSTWNTASANAAHWSHKLCGNTVPRLSVTHGGVREWRVGQRQSWFIATTANGPKGGKWGRCGGWSCVTLWRRKKLCGKAALHTVRWLRLRHYLCCHLQTVHLLSECGF